MFCINSSHECVARELTEDFVSVFAFAQNTEYDGKTEFRHRELDLFKLSVSTRTLNEMYV